MKTLHYLTGIALLTMGMTLSAAEPNVDHPILIDQQVKQAPKSIVDTLKSDGHFKILIGALQDTELESILCKDGIQTFFAPTDRAFERVPELSKLLTERAKLIQVLNHHLVPNKAFEISDLRSMVTLQAKDGEPIQISVQADHLEIDGARITLSDLRAFNGVVHAIDHVLIKNNDSLLNNQGVAGERNMKKGGEAIKASFEKVGE